MHWHLDVHSGKMPNTTLDKMAAQKFEYHKKMEPGILEAAQMTRHVVDEKEKGHNVKWSQFSIWKNF